MAITAQQITASVVRSKREEGTWPLEVSYEYENETFTGFTSKHDALNQLIRFIGGKEDTIVLLMVDS